MIFVTLGIWLLLILVAGLGLYRYWTRRLGGAVVDWLMLPATLVSETAYSAGRLMTGRPAFGGLISPQDVNTDACRFAISGKHGFFVSMLSSFLTLVLCGLALAATAKWIGRDMIQSLVLGGGLLEPAWLPKNPPLQWDAFWDVLAYQIRLLRGFLETLGRQNWLDWRVWLFVYLSAGLSVRLGPVRHDWRATLVVGAILVGLLAAAAAIFPAVRDFVDGTLWCVLTYVWALLLGLMAATLIVTGLAAVVYPFLPASMRAK
ncbi:MAG: hypothetical protein JW849_09725 [Phycisphaerae bacterium]|nr:hypothetical protein [Phycisphaerae bacterium]